MCGLEFPDLETSVWQAMRDKGVTVIGLNTGGLNGGDSAPQVKRFVDQTGVTFPVGWDANNSYRKFPALGAASPFPLDVVIDREGRIAYFSREYDAVALLAAVTALAGQ